MKKNELIYSFIQKRNTFLLVILFYLFFITSYAQIQIGNDIDGDEAYGHFGFSTALNNNGDILIGGNPQGHTYQYKIGKARVYQYDGSDWQQKGNVLQGDIVNGRFGHSVAINGEGDIVAISEPEYNSASDDNPGKVRIYKFEGGDWNQIGSTLNGTSNDDKFGFSISLNDQGNILAIGKPSENTIGEVHIYEFNGSDWVLLGDIIYAQQAGDNTGVIVKLNSQGNIIAISGPSSDNVVTKSGHVLVYEFNSTNWVQLGNIIVGDHSYARFGGALNINNQGNIVAIGSPLSNYNGTSSGHASVYKLLNNVWTLKGNTIYGDSQNLQFATSLTLNDSGKILAIGIPRYNVGFGGNIGRVDLYEFLNGDWTYLNSIIGENYGDSSGYGIDFNEMGNILAIGATGNDAGANNAGHVRVFDISDLLSLETFSNILNVIIYPNPTESQITIKNPTNYKINQVRIKNIEGKTIKEFNVNENDEYLNVDLRELENSMYFVTIEYEQGLTLTKKIIKK